MHESGNLGEVSRIQLQGVCCDTTRAWERRKNYEDMYGDIPVDLGRFHYARSEVALAHRRTLLSSPMLVLLPFQVISACLIVTCHVIRPVIV